LAEFGAQACCSSAEAAEDADAAIVIVLNADQVEEVVFGPDGLAHKLRSGAPIVSMSTMSPVRTRALAARAADRGLRWLDAPVSGGTERAREGTLTTMAGRELVLLTAEAVLSTTTAPVSAAACGTESFGMAPIVESAVA